MPSIAPSKIARDNDEYNAALLSLSKQTHCSLFSLSTCLPSKGRVDIPLAASDQLTLVLKAYASGGENALHAHNNEDHSFLVLQGTARFYGEENVELGTVGAFEGIFIPRGAFYRFEATSSDPLVMFRVGALDPGSLSARVRTGADGKPLGGYDAANKDVGFVLDEQNTFPSGRMLAP